MSDWFVTDGDCLQCCRPIPPIDPEKYEFVQINSFPGHVDGKPFFQTAQATINVKDYADEDILSALGFFGYEDMDDFVCQNAPDGNFVYNEDGTLDRENSPSYIIDYQLIAEMLFETDVQEYVENEFPSWNEAVERIEKLTGLELGNYRKEEQTKMESIYDLNDALVFGECIEGNKRTYFIAAPSEIANKLGISADYLVNDLVDTYAVFGTGIATIYEKGEKKYDLLAAEDISKMPVTATLFIAESIRAARENGGIDSFEMPSPSTLDLLTKLMLPIDRAGISDVGMHHNVMSALHFRKENAEYVKALGEIFSSFGLLSVERDRRSVTQGEAVVSCGEKTIVRYGDTIYLQQKDGKFSNGFHSDIEGQFYGPVIGGWGSLTPDNNFVEAALTQYPARIYRAFESREMTQKDKPSLDRQIAGAEDRVSPDVINKETSKGVAR